MALFLTLLLGTGQTSAVGNQIMGPTTVYKPITSLVTVNDILNLYSSYGNVIRASEDNYTGFGATVGTYRIVLTANDGLNDVASKNIDVVVVDSTVSSKIKVVTDNGNIYVNANDPITHSQIILSLAALDLIYYNPQTSSPYLLKDDYTQNSATPGYYQFQFRLVDLSGLDNTYQILIFVSDTQTLMPTPIDMGGGGSMSFWDIAFLAIIGFVVYVVASKVFPKGSTKKIKPY